MCGIIGYVGSRAPKPLLIQGLQRLEYRGYDSAGIALLEDDGLDYVRAVGNLQELKTKAGPNGSVATTGLGHTRWATHGGVTEQNAHPLTACDDSRLAIVLNGIVENYRELRDELRARGHSFTSETDAEVVAHLVEDAYEGDVVAAVRAVYARLEGHFTFVVIHADQPQRLIGVRNQTPMVVGLGDGENFIASNLAAFLAETRRVQFPDDGEIAEITPEGVAYTDAITGASVEPDVASEWIYRNPVLDPGTLVIGISQSGETRDTIQAMKLARSRGARTVAITNMMGSQITREVDSVLYTRTGLEVGVAASKTFTAQIALSYLIGLKLAEVRGTLPENEIEFILDELYDLPEKMRRFLDADHPIDDIARRFHDQPFFLYLGRHIGLPVALEGALKLKEISYIPTEAYSAGEMKHGPISLLEEGTPVVVVATNIHVYDKIVSNIQETRARGAHVI